MAKVTDCIECKNEIIFWTETLKSPYNRARHISKQQIKLAKKNHGRTSYHLYIYDFQMAQWVKNCAGKELIHNGRR